MKKNLKNLNFLLFFSNKPYFFCLKMNSMWKMRFFEVLHVDIAQKLQILKILTIFSDFSVEFQFSLFLGRVMEKNLKKGQMSWNWRHLSGKHDFWAKFGSRAKIDRGAPGAPPAPGKASQTSHWLGLRVLIKYSMGKGVAGL